MLKRSFDIVVSLSALLALSPVLLAIAVMVRARMGSPVLFRQMRPGLHSRPFRLCKFRTMLDAVDRNGKPLPDGDRLTPLGRMLRSTSLDELPQLWNVLTGDLSLVGPRPLLMSYLDRYSSNEARRHEVRPGITGLAQVEGRNALSWDEKFRLDVWYVDHRSFAMDLNILARTALIVLRRSGVNSADAATMPEFMGDGAAPTQPDMSPRRTL